MSLLEQVANALEDYTGIDEHHYQRAALALAVVERWLREKARPIAVLGQASTICRGGARTLVELADELAAQAKAVRP